MGIRSLVKGVWRKREAETDRGGEYTHIHTLDETVRYSKYSIFLESYNLSKSDSLNG